MHRGGRKEQGAGQAKDSLLSYSALLLVGQPQDREETTGSSEYCYQLNSKEKDSIEVEGTISRSTKWCLLSSSSLS